MTGQMNCANTVQRFADTSHPAIKKLDDPYSDAIFVALRVLKVPLK